MPRARKLSALLAGSALLCGTLVGVATTGAQANPAGTGLVISEVYGAGGNTGAVRNADFVELYNPTAEPIGLSGLTLQYRSSGGTGAANGVAALSGSVPAGKHFLVATSPTTDPDGAALPAPDLEVTGVNMAAGAGTVYLSTSATALTLPTGSVTGHPQVVDLVGFGGTNTSETLPTPALSTSLSAKRSATGADSDRNNVDLTVSAPDPQNCACSTPPEVVVEDATIAEIQGTGFESPYADQPLTYPRTRGVVTAAYPSGGFWAFVIQTEGSGDATDETPGASDALWVRQTSGSITVQPGDHVEVTAPVEEYFGLTRMDYDPTDVDASLTVLAGAAQPVTPLAGDYPSTSADREAHESELLDVSGQAFTVTDNYGTNQYAEIGLATGDRPLVHPLEVGAPGSAEADAQEAENLARGVVLDDGSSTNYLSGSAQDRPLPWLTPTNPIRVGSAARLHAPVVLDYQFGAWRFQPTRPVTDEGADVATFENTRTEDAAPQDVGGDLKLATFNVLNYFNTTGADYVAAGGSCTFYIDRDGDPVTNRDCGSSGPRGAAEAEDLERQQAKIVAALNTMDADIVSLEEIENSVKLGEPRDDALAALVDALNAAAGTTRWAFVPSPDASELPPVADQDVIRNAFIYDPATVELVGTSDVLADDPDFANAREPLAQVFRAAGAPQDEAFAVIVNHFKSKGDSFPPQSGNDNADAGNGAGAFNGDRTRQAQSLATYAESFAAERGVEKVFLAGDFNSYTMEDPMRALYEAGYTAIESDTEGEETYSFDGLYGSLDHVLANDAALADVTGADIWNINSVESVAFEYSRHNYNVTDFYQPGVFRASDHNPEVVGIDVPGFPAEPVDTTVSATGGEFPYGEDVTIPVHVDSANPTTGTVEVLAVGEVVGSAAVEADDAATVTVAAGTLDVGRHTLDVRYSGDELNHPSATTVDVDVVKARPTLTVDVDPDRATTKTPVRLTVSLAAPGQTVTGWVWVHTGHDDQLRRLEDGAAVFDLGRFTRAGTYDVWLTYSGSRTAEPVAERVTLRVEKP